MRNAARSGWELSRPEELIFELFRRGKPAAIRAWRHARLWPHVAAVATWAVPEK
jgi:hypothetical protein